MHHQVSEDCPAIDIAKRAEKKADTAVDHALETHQNVGILIREVSSLKLWLASELANMRADFHNRMESVPDLVQGEITDHHNLAELKRYRWLKSRVGKVTVAGLKALAIAVAGFGAREIAHLLKWLP